MTISKPLYEMQRKENRSQQDGGSVTGSVGALWGQSRERYGVGSVTGERYGVSPRIHKHRLTNAPRSVILMASKNAV